MKRKRGCVLLFLGILFFSSNVQAQKRILTYADLVRQNLTLRQNLQDEREEYSDVVNERAVLILRLKKMQVEKAQLRLQHKKEMIKKNQEILNLKDQHTLELKKDEEVIAGKVKKIKVLDQKRAGLEASKKSLEIKIKENGSVIAEKDKIIDALKEKNQKLGQALEYTKKHGKEKIATQESELKKLTAKNIKLLGETDRLKKILEQDKKEAEKIIQELLAEKNSFEQEMQQVKENWKKEKFEMNAQLLTANRIIEKLQKDINRRYVLYAQEGVLAKKGDEPIAINEEFEKALSEAKLMRNQLEKNPLIQDLQKEILRDEIQRQRELQEVQNEEIEGLKLDKFTMETKLEKSKERFHKKVDKMAEMRVRTIKRQIKKERLDMHYNLAVVFDKSGMYEDSEREYIKCLVLNPKDADVHYNLGILYDDKLNKNLKAIEHYEKYLELRPLGEDSIRVKQWILNAEQEKRMGFEIR